MPEWVWFLTLAVLLFHKFSQMTVFDLGDWIHIEFQKPKKLRSKKPRNRRLES